MQCAYCRETIDNDSFFCDMCGEEIKICPRCKNPGKSKMCTICGKPLVYIKSQTELQGKNGQPEDIPITVPSESKSHDLPIVVNGTFRLPDNTKQVSGIPELRILNKNINLDLKIDNNTIIGRTSGQYTSVLSGYNQISSKHCRFNYDIAMGWNVTDLGSTNKTHYNNQALVPNIPQILNDQAFLKIANIEFFIKIIPC